MKKRTLGEPDGIEKTKKRKKGFLCTADLAFGKFAGSVCVIPVRFAGLFVECFAVASVAKRLVFAQAAAADPHGFFHGLDFIGPGVLGLL